MLASIHCQATPLSAAARRGNAWFPIMFRALIPRFSLRKWDQSGCPPLPAEGTRPVAVNVVLRFPAPACLKLRPAVISSVLSCVASEEYPMAPRANWKGFLRLSLVTCPVALYPATSDTEKVSFNQINRKTGHRIKYAKVDADTGEEVANEDIVKGYKVDTDTYIEVSKEELENVALESTRTIE